MRKYLLLLISAVIILGFYFNLAAAQKIRVIVNTDGEVDDQCSLVRFLLYADEFDVEGIIKTSSQYHAQDHNWAGDNWEQPYLDVYAQVYPNLIKHDTAYPTPEYLQSVTKLGNVKTEDDTSEVTPGSQLIVNVLLDTTDNRPIWLISWGGINTIARALETIEETHPEKMAYVANKIRFFFIWEQDGTYQSYIRPHWGKYNILTIISDQFWCFAYDWNKIMPADKQVYLKSDWMTSNILNGHGQLCLLYQAYKQGEKSGYNGGDFRSEGDSPSFIYLINTGLSNGNLEHPNWGSWGGRYIKVRENTWLDSVPEPNYTYPTGRWYTSTAWGRNYMRSVYPSHPDWMTTYYRPIVRWVDALQNDFAARANWCVKSYAEANHPPVVLLNNTLEITAHPGDTVQLSAKGSYDPDGDQLAYSWWQYEEAGSYIGNIDIQNAGKQNAFFTIPIDAGSSEAIHVICEVTDNGTPPLTRYQRVILTVENATDVKEKEGSISTNFNLEQNYPNPFNPNTTIEYSIPNSTHVTLEIFNVVGEEVTVLVDEMVHQGVHKEVWNASGLPSGLYFYRLQAGNFQQTKKLVLLK